MEIDLTPEQYKRLPYKNTTIIKGKTYGDIIGMLESHGIHDYQWTRYQGSDQLAFPIKIKRHDVEEGFLVKLTVPRIHYLLRVGKGRNAPKRRTYLEKQSWRIFWWHLKSKLEAIEFGISDEVREFMYDISYALPDGTEVNLGQTLIDNVDAISKLSLEDKRGVKADYKVLET